jgi:hypothetical protein
MTDSILPFVRDRLEHLAAMPRQLKDRVREAVAGELGRIVSETVRELLTTILRPRSEDNPRPRVEYYSAYSDEPDDWDVERSHCMTNSNDMSTKSSWTAAISVGVLVIRWLWQRRFPLWPCLGAAALAGAATYHGSPVIHASLAAVSSAADLIDLTQSRST